MGVPAGQYTQVREEKKHSLEWYEALFAAVAAAIVAALPCFSVMRQYKMQKEHRQSLGFHMAYRADSALHFVQNEEQFVNRSVVTRRIPKIRVRALRAVRLEGRPYIGAAAEGCTAAEAESFN